MYTMLEMPDITALFESSIVRDELGLHVSIALLSANKDDREDAKARLRTRYPCLRSAYVADNLIVVRYRTGNQVKTYWAGELGHTYRNNTKSVHPFVLA